LAGISDRAFSKRRKKIIDVAVKSGDLEIARILALPFYAEDTLKALQEAKGDRKEAARMLGITITPLFKRIKRIKNIAKEIGDKDMLDKMKDARKKTPKYPAYTEGTLKALKASNGNRTEAAGRLGVNRRTIHKRIERIKGIASQVGDEAVLEKLRLKKLVPAAKPAAKPVKRPRTRQASSEKPKRVKLTEIIRQSSLVKLISQATGIPEEKITEKFTKGKGKLTSEDLKFERGKALIPLKKILKNVYGKFRDVIYDFGFEEDAVKIAFISGARMYTVLIVLGAKSWRAEDSSPYLAVSRRDPGKVALLLEVAEKLSDKHYLDLAPVAGTENAEEKGLAEAFTEFNALCRENLKLIRRYIEEGNNEAAANCAAQITQGRKSAFAHISNNDFKDLMTDLLQSIGAISLFIHGALEKEALYECLDETEKSLTELEKLMIAGRLREAGKARVRSGLFDASLVLGPGEGAAPKCFNSGRSGERKKVSYQDLEFLPEYDGVCIGFDKRYYGKTMEETFNPGRFLEFKKKKGEHALLVHDTLARALGLFRDMLISSLSDEKRADEAMELYDAFWNDVRRHRGLLIRIASNLPWDSALLETGGIPVLVFNEEFFKDAILGYYFPHEYDPEDPDARNEHRYTSLWPLCERLNHELSHSGLFKDDKLEEMKEEAGCIYRDLLFLKIILLAESNLDMKGRVDKYMENLHDRYGSNNYYEFLYSLVKAKKSKAKSKIWAYVTKHREGHQAFGIKPFPSDLSKEKIIAGKALENIGNATNDLEKARNIFMWVRENMAYAFDLGWDAPVSEVLEKGYGHCGNLSRLTLALLKASGIRSRLVIRHMSSKFYRNFIMPRIYRAMDNSKKGRSRHAYVEAFIDGKWHVLDYILNSNISEKSHPEDRDPEEAVFESFDECLSEYPPLANKERVRKYLTRQFYRNHFSEWDGRYRLVREIQELFSATKPTRLDEVPAAGVEKPGSPAGEGGGTNNPNAGFTFAEFLTGFGTLVGGALVLINKPLKGFLSSWAAHAP
ncbi:MAG: transglutaminase domain-containing protein, partial [Candidatus Omnitrophota bacterium]